MKRALKLTCTQSTRNVPVHVLPHAGQPSVGTGNIGPCGVESLYPGLWHALSSSHTPSPQTQPSTLC